MKRHPAAAVAVGTSEGVMMAGSASLLGQLSFILFGWDGLRFGFQCLAGVGDGEARRKRQACRAWDGWIEQPGRARAEAFQEAAVRGLFRKGLDKEVPSSDRKSVVCRG